MDRPDGWVTDVLPNRKALRVLGAGVVASQARLAQDLIDGADAPIFGDAGVLLPTPTAAQPGGTAEQHLARKARMADGACRTSVTDLRMALEELAEAGHPDFWGPHMPAIVHWARVAGRPAPGPFCRPSSRSG